MEITAERPCTKPKEMSEIAKQESINLHPRLPWNLRDGILQRRPGISEFAFVARAAGDSPKS